MGLLRRHVTLNLETLFQRDVWHLSNLCHLRLVFRTLDANLWGN